MGVIDGVFVVDSDGVLDTVGVVLGGLVTIIGKAVVEVGWMEFDAEGLSIEQAARKNIKAAGNATRK